MKGETAPELARSYKAMRDHAEEVTKRANELEVDLGKLKAEIGEKEGLLSTNYLSGRVDGLLTAGEMLVKAQQSVATIAESTDSLDVFLAFNEVTGKLLEIAQVTNDRAKEQSQSKDSKR